jgi:hypothetical protein
MSASGQKLFDLLPAVYRIKDAQLAQSQNLLSASETAQLQALQASASSLTATQQTQLDQLTAKAARGPLQSLLMLIEEQVAAVANDLGQLYDDQFVETCAPWVIPYIGDLIGYQSVNGIAPGVASPRAEVANTISFRRRKGTVLVLEQLARDVTGWGARAVEFFEVLADTQYMNHLRPHNHYAPDLRRWEPRAYMNTGFDATAHTVDVRRIAVERGRYNIQNIGIFLWSLNAYGLKQSPAQPAPPTNGSLCFRFSTLGRDMPLFNHPVFQGSEITAPARPVNVPDRLKRRVLCQDLQCAAEPVYYGEGNSLALYLDGAQTPLNPNQIQVCDLSGAEGAWVNVPPAGSTYSAAVDPHLGRIALPPVATGASAPLVQASFHYGFNGDMGGGDYARESGFAVQPEVPPPVTLYSQTTSGGITLLAALLAAIPPQDGHAALEITDDGIYSLAPQSPGPVTVTLQPRSTFEFRAATGFRPTIVLGGKLSVSGGAGSRFYLNGLLVTFNPPSGGVALPAALVDAPNDPSNQLSLLAVTHCTLVPGWALTPQGEPQPLSAAQPVLVAALAGLEIEVKSSILGGIRADEGVTVNISDSIVDATSPTNMAYAASDGLGGGGALTLTGCTVIGKVHATLLALVSNCIFWAGLEPKDAWPAPLWADRKQQGCVRFSYLPEGAVTPRTFQCLLEGVGIPGPLFASLRYGDPEYGKLLASTNDAVRRGADDGGEMGAFHFVLAPLRETDLRVRLLEYMPVGLEFGIFYET